MTECYFYGDDASRAAPAPLKVNRCRHRLLTGMPYIYGYAVSESTPIQGWNGYE
ncbi:hypothetical protein [Arthrobacter alpinus]|uniref:hypothetical protein n=1 Tax=Arthrobacter alpinus TaxID=656366 RepID=UPI0012FEF05F|nr:hypothetical protein [Arthrobacter alpinus]